MKDQKIFYKIQIFLRPHISQNILTLIMVAITFTISPEAKVKAKQQGFQICMVSWVYFLKSYQKGIFGNYLKTSSNFLNCHSF